MFKIKIDNQNCNFDKNLLSEIYDKNEDEHSSFFCLQLNPISCSNS